MREITLTNTLQCAELRYSINTHISISWFLPQSSLRFAIFLYALLCISYAVTHHNPTSMPSLSEIGVFASCFCVWRVLLSCGELTSSLSSLLFNSTCTHTNWDTSLWDIASQFGPKLQLDFFFLPKEKSTFTTISQYENGNIRYNHRWSCLGYLRRQ